MTAYRKPDFYMMLFVLLFQKYCWKVCFDKYIYKTQVRILMPLWKIQNRCSVVFLHIWETSSSFDLVHWSTVTMINMYFCSLYTSKWREVLIQSARWYLWGFIQDDGLCNFYLQFLFSWTSYQLNSAYFILFKYVLQYICTLDVNQLQLI